MATLTSTVNALLAKSDRPAVRAFFLSMAALTIALILALYSGAAAQLGSLFLASASALTALVVAGWVAVTLVPTLAKRTPLRWIGYRMEYRITRDGWIYILGIVLVALAAINTGNNLLFLILASLIASILMSGILSSITLAGVELKLHLPEHIFAGQSMRATVELRNEKLTLPSFSLRVEAAKTKDQPAAAMLETPVYFPYLPRQQSVKQHVPLLFPQRGVYRQEAFKIVTRFPFGFLQKARRMDLAAEALVYPAVAASSEFLEVLPGLQGAMESHAKGRGQDLYALRGYLPNDSARHVHWKASARFGALMVREFAREDDCRVLLVFDPQSPAAAATPPSSEKESFERAVTFCAALAWNFHERSALLEFRSAEASTPPAPASENIFAILRHLALVQPIAPNSRPELLNQLAADPNSFKIIVTSQPRGSIPAELWNTSYIVFASDLSA
ncbi:MAG TPA: DUF58 domain-containing protein [Candidatus Sulfotelmatobacter sp.]|jgi:uncharacterized protein (DUF58 family)|nr:DUF58 domain-containing protein [Candidatus Sulfotelmatobacter sp.]